MPRPFALFIALLFSSVPTAAGLAAPFLRSDGSSGFAPSLVVRVSALSDELARMRTRAWRQGCSRSFFFRNRSRSCLALNRNIQRLERRLHSATRQGRLKERRPAETASGKYRTVCVRVCDGYFFPLNFAATRKRFALEEKKCTAHYAPREAMLFYYPSGDEGPRRAVSMRGEPYSEKPYAFGHHRAFGARCADQLHKGMATLAQKTLEGRNEARASSSAPIVPVPLARPDLASDPESLANRAGGFQRSRPSFPTADPNSGDALCSDRDDVGTAENNRWIQSGRAP
jgi:hypothetical protein